MEPNDPFGTEGAEVQETPRLPGESLHHAVLRQSIRHLHYRLNEIKEDIKEIKEKNQDYDVRMRKVEGSQSKIGGAAVALGAAAGYLSSWWHRT